MTQIQEIEQAIAKLPREEFFELVRHLRERHAQEWDRQIEEDAQSEYSGRFISASKPKIRVSRKCRSMISSTTKSFRSRFLGLPPEVRRLARKNFKLWLRDSRHPSLHFKKVGDFWSARIGDSLAIAPSPLWKPANYRTFSTGIRPCPG